jgi:hypothetical protein
MDRDTPLSQCVQIRKSASARARPDRDDRKVAKALVHASKVWKP